MNTSFERGVKATDEWYTPKEIIDSLGEFDLDPCSPMNRLWDTAKKHYTAEDDGLKQEWEGRVWLNPPYSKPLIDQFVEKMAQHNNGIALLFNRCDNKMFHDVIFPNATAMLFMRKRIKFYRPDGTQGDSLYGIGEVVAIKQSYCDVMISNSHHNTLAIATKYKTSAGWNNKMFVKASLMPLHINMTNIRVERLQDISEEDCLKEGIKKNRIGGYYYTNAKGIDPNPRVAFASLIDEVTVKGTWESNPWVFVFEYEMVKK